MKLIHWFGLSMIFGALVLNGCQQGTSKRSDKEKSAQHKEGEHKDDDKNAAKINAVLAKLSPEDRKLAEAQKICPNSGDPLGTMGPPVKVMVKDQPVFLCCNGCREKVLADPDKTLAKVKELKAKAGK